MDFLTQAIHVDFIAYSTRPKGGVIESSRRGESKEKKIRKAGDLRAERKKWGGNGGGKKVGKKDLTVYLGRQVLFLWPLESII